MPCICLVSGVEGSFVTLAWFSYTICNAGLNVQILLRLWFFISLGKLWQWDICAAEISQKPFHEFLKSGTLLILNIFTVQCASWHKVKATRRKL